MAGKYLSTPPAGQSPGMAIEKNPYASDAAGGYNMFTGDYEATKQDLWTRLMDALAQMGKKPPSKPEFDAYFDEMAQGSPPVEEGPVARFNMDEDPWKKIMQSLKPYTPVGESGPLPPPAPSPKQAFEPDMMDKPLPADYATREEYEAALEAWQSGGKNSF